MTYWSDLGWCKDRALVRVGPVENSGLVERAPYRSRTRQSARAESFLSLRVNSLA